MSDINDVQMDVVPEGTTPPEVIVPQELSMEDKLARMVEEKVAAEISKATEQARREIQSTKDKAKSEVDSAVKRAKLAERTMSAAQTHLQSIDPEIAKELELIQYRAEKQGIQTIEQEEATAQQQATFHSEFYNGLSQYVTTLGIDPKDERIDWGSDSGNYLEAQKRVLESVGKIQKANLETMETGFNKRLKDLETKFGRVNVEVNSVDTAASSGVVAGSDAEFMKMWGAGSLPSTKENAERAKKIQNSY